MKALVLQMRGNGDSSRATEQQEYLKYTGLQPQQVDFFDLYDHPIFNPKMVFTYDMVFAGGISRDDPYELTWPVQQFPFIQNLHDLLRLVIKRRIPTLLSCGGFLIAGTMLGARMLGKQTNFELGVYPLQKTEAANRDLLLGPVQDRIPMVCGHVKYFDQTPPGTELLLYTNEYDQRVPVHAFKVKHAPFYAFQGHPEISCAELFERVRPMAYRRHYFPPRADHPKDQLLGYNEEGFQAFCALEADTSEAQVLLTRFVELVREGKFKI